MARFFADAIVRPTNPLLIPDTEEDLADIFYVLRGTATFVTGGTVVGGKTTAPNEILGASIRDGKTHQLVKGDVIIVPQSTPHWFKQVEAPFLYFVVKVR